MRELVINENTPCAKVVTPIYVCFVALRNAKNVSRLDSPLSKAHWSRIHPIPIYHALRKLHAPR
jgi:hypothetical protein